MVKRRLVTRSARNDAPLPPYTDTNFKIKTFHLPNIRSTSCTVTSAMIYFRYGETTEKVKIKWCGNSVCNQQPHCQYCGTLKTALTTTVICLSSDKFRWALFVTQRAQTAVYCCGTSNKIIPRQTTSQTQRRQTRLPTSITEIANIHNKLAGQVTENIFYAGKRVYTVTSPKCRSV